MKKRMKKRIISIFTALIMVLTLLPTAVFADVQSYDITNGTPESAKETNHGYIAIDKATAAKDETVTVTVNPAEGYQLKSLTVTPAAISTIADVLATVEGFPEDTSGGTSPVAPSSSWINENGVDAFKYSSALILQKDGYTYGQLSTTVEEKENCYTATISYGSLTFNMENGILTSFEFTADPSKPNAADYVGTYTPAGTPSGRKPITPAKQTDGTYQFTMPAYTVTVTAEFEAIGGTGSGGKTLPYSFDFEADPFSEANGWTNIDYDGDGQDWKTGTTAYAGNGFGIEESECAISQSYDNSVGSFNADNWLFSPAITIPAGGAKVSWYEQSQDSSWPDYYEVYVSETNTEIDLSKMTKTFSGTAAHPWTQRSVELKAAEYAGKTVYIAFRHLSYDCYFLEIDDFAVEALAAPATYAITNGTAEGDKETNHGYISIDKETAAENDTVTVTVTPNEGYVLKTLKYNDGTTDHEITKDATSGNYQFTMPAYPVTVTATFEAEYHYTTYENWQIKYGNTWVWTGNLTKDEDGLYKMEILWEGTGFNVASDDNPIKKDWYAPDDPDVTIGEEVIAPVTVDVYLRVIDDETLKIGIGVDPAPAPTYTVTFPEGPEQVYIIGDTSNWTTFVPMTMTSKTTATITLDTPFTEYKYTAGADWAYVEKDAQGGEISNRTAYANPDVVGSWAAVPTPAGVATWPALLEAISAADGNSTTPATETTTIQLTDDLTAPAEGGATITIPAGKDITLDLNGHVINANGGEFCVINVNNGAKLTFIDSTPTTEHYFKVDADGLWTLTDTKTDTTKTVAGGVITGGNNTAFSGGGVYVSGAFTMLAGNIIGNKTTGTNFYGGGIYATGKDSVVTIKGGTISGNVSDYGGGGVFLNKECSSSTIENVTISDNVAKIKAGGGINIRGGNITIKNAIITGNTTATYGGGVYITDENTDDDKDTTLTMENVTISNNEAAGFGGGAYVSTGGIVTIKEGTISGNTSATYGGGIQVNATAKLYLAADEGKTISITDNTAAQAGGGVIAKGEMHLAGKVVIKDNICTNTYGDSVNYPVNLAVEMPIYIDGALTGSKIFVTYANSADDMHNTGVLTSGFTTSNEGAQLGDFFTYDGPSDFEMVLNEDGELELKAQPAHSGNNTSTITIPASSDENSIDIKATVSGKTATVQPIKDEAIQKVIGNDEGSGMLTIDLSGTNKTITGVKLPTENVKAIAEAAAENGSDTAGLKLELSSGTLEFDAKALETIVAAAGDAANIEIHFDEVGTIRLNKVQKEAVSEMYVLEGFEAYITVNGKRVSDFEGGNVTVYIPYEVPEDKDPAAYTVWYIAEDGTLEKMDATYDGENHRFVVTHFSDYVLTYDETVGQYNNCLKDETCPMAKFTDVDMKAWYHDGVHYCLDNGIMAGKGDGKFAPSGVTTRAQIAQILYNLEGQPAFMNDNVFTDVASGSWYEKAVVWAQGKGIVSGYTDGSFKPDAPITREQLAVILYNYAQYKGIDVSVDENTNFLSFNDFWDVSEWAKPAMMWAIDRELIVGSNWDLKPQGDAVRAQAATIICKFCETVAK